MYTAGNIVEYIIIAVYVTAFVTMDAVKVLVSSLTFSKVATTEMLFMVEFERMEDL